MGISAFSIENSQTFANVGGRDAKGVPSYQISTRQQCEQLRGQLWLELGTFVALWRSLGQFILPRRPRFTTADVNKGDRRDGAIIDSTATSSAGTLAAGMMAGVTSPARPWFQLRTGNAELDEKETVKEWCYEVERRMATVFLRSNLYNKLPVLYKDMAVFATGAIAIMEDDDSVIRCFDFPIGSFAVANDDVLRVRTFLRMFRLSVGQVVQRWGKVDKQGKPDFQRGEPSVVSVTVQNLYNRNTLQAWVDIVHVIRPNISYDGTKIDPKYKRFEDIYYELGSPNNPMDANLYGLLQHSGFDEFPILVGRWEVNSEDVYGTMCPGIQTLGDIKQLQMGEKRSAQAIEKMINPPLVAPARMNNIKISTIPGDVSYDSGSDITQSVRPMYQVTFHVEQLEAKQEQVRERIKHGFFEDLFLMLANLDKNDITATEILERKEEKLLAVGPVLEQLNQDVLDPLIDRTFAIMARKGLLPEAPPELQGMGLRVEYVSVMAQAQKSVGIQGLERAAGFVNQIAQTIPDILDRVNSDELVEQYFDASGVPPKILRSDEQTAQIRQARADAQKKQQAAENAPIMADAAKMLSETSTEGNSALAQMLAKARARQTMDATAQPVAA